MTTKHTSDTFKTGDARYGLMARLTGAIIIGLVFLAAATPAQAIKLVSNFEQNGGPDNEGLYHYSGKGVAQKFTTGSNASLYSLRGIRVRTNGGGMFNVRLCTSVGLGSGSSSGPRSCTTLNRPGSQEFAPGKNPRFTPSPDFSPQHRIRPHLVV